MYNRGGVGPPSFTRAFLPYPLKEALPYLGKCDYTFLRELRKVAPLFMQWIWGNKMYGTYSLKDAERLHPSKLNKWSTWSHVGFCKLMFSPDFQGWRVKPCQTSGWVGGWSFPAWPIDTEISWLPCSVSEWRAAFSGGRFRRWALATASPYISIYYIYTGKVFSFPFIKLRSLLISLLPSWLGFRRMVTKKHTHSILHLSMCHSYWVRWSNILQNPSESP